MKQGSNTSIDDIEYDDDEVEYAIQTVVGFDTKRDADGSTAKPPKAPLAAKAADLMGEFKRKYPDIIVDNNNHETDHRGG